ncbi:hypothetical protein LZC95_08105 [Pendulispora brunnea]|uniref:Tail fiber protein n=1 Tax=Pendulispora brunnea TaxID=2905690 RepID=A0ABZ2KDT4_9BACT
MPAPPYAKILVLVNGGPPQTGGVVAPSGASIQLVAENTVEWRSWRWEITDYPRGFALPAGWVADANGLFFSVDVTPAALTLPQANSLFGKWLLRLVVNNGIDEFGIYNPARMVDESTAFEVVSPFGLHDVGAGEAEQFGGAQKAWVGALQDNWRRINALLGPVAAPSGTGFAHITNGVYDSPARLVTDADIVGPIDPKKVALAVPTGTGFTHVSNGAVDGSAKLVEDADVAVGAKVASSKVSFAAGVTFPSGASIIPAPDGSQRILVAGEIRGNDARNDPLNFGLTPKALTGGSVSLTAAEYAALTIRFTGALTSAAIVIFPAVAGYAKLLRNDTSGAFPLTVKTASGNGLVVPQGQSMWVFCDGVNLISGSTANAIVSAQAAHLTSQALANQTNFTDVSALSIAFPLAVAGYKIEIKSIVDLGINTNGYIAETAVAVVDGASTVVIPETMRGSSPQGGSAYEFAVTIYTVANTGPLTVKQQLRTSSQSQFVHINPPSSLVATLLRP